MVLIIMVPVDHLISFVSDPLADFRRVIYQHLISASGRYHRLRPVYRPALQIDSPLSPRGPHFTILREKQSLGTHCEPVALVMQFLNVTVHHTTLLAKTSSASFYAT